MLIAVCDISAVCGVRCAVCGTLIHAVCVVCAAMCGTLTLAVCAVCAAVCDNVRGSVRLSGCVRGDVRLSSGAAVCEESGSKHIFK
jgi:hypothetical protein